MSIATHEQRREPRFHIRVPVRIDAGAGVAQNISAGGVYIETDLAHELGSLVTVALEYTAGGRTHQLQCEGKVVRVDPSSDRVGVAARLVSPFFAGTESVTLPAG